MKELSRVAADVQASTTMAIDSLYKKMKADGIDVIGFGAGEPDFNTPDHIKEAAVTAIQNNFTKYTPPAGIDKLRQAVCDRLLVDCGVSYKPSQVVIASGAKHNVFIALVTLLNPGDEVILPAPYWVSYYELIKMAGGVPVIVEAPESCGFKITPDQLAKAITDKTKAVIINNPSNPTGMLYDEAELRAIGRICVEHDIYIIADEIYYRLVYGDKKFVSVASLEEKIKELTILINGVSKSYSMTGWRIGYAAAPEPIAKLMANYLSHSTSAPSSISQAAAVSALEGSQDCVDTMRSEFDKRRKYIVERINRIDGVSCLMPEGAFYVMMNMESLIGKTLYGDVIRDADDFANLFLRKGLVAVVPCTGFGAPKHIRWSYATSMENIKEGMDRLEKFLKG